MAVQNSTGDVTADADSDSSSQSTVSTIQPFPQLRNNAATDVDTDVSTASSRAAMKTRSRVADAGEDNDDDEDPVVAKPFLRTLRATSADHGGVRGSGCSDSSLDEEEDDEVANSGGGGGGGPHAAQAGSGGQGGGAEGRERRTAIAQERLGHKMHKFTLYETASRYYIVGEDVTGRRYRVLKIDRTTSSKDGLSLTDDRIVYSQKEMIQLLDTIDDGNRLTGGIKVRCTMWGLLGFIRFTGPYYMMLITKKSTVAVIGGHTIYQITGTELVPLTPGRGAGRALEHVSSSTGESGGGGDGSSNGNASGNNNGNTTTNAANSSTTTNSNTAHHHSGPSVSSADEARFLTIFNQVNLAQSFYFSYSYDLTHTLQHNISKERTALASGRRWPCDEDHNSMFVWNTHLLQAARAALAAPFDWCRPITHGYMDQASISIYGRTAYVAIIARRSRHFAGARFLKRGANDLGYVANDVETEQIVSEASTTSFHSPGRRLFANAQYTSYVQHRGSIPLYWTQENTGVTPKPPIELNLVDPFYSAAALHFDDLFARYGAPIYVLDLVKARESTPRESKLLEEFQRATRYLNQFLPADRQIVHHAWDMSRANKSRDVNVIEVLEAIAERVVATTGFFRNGEGDGSGNGSSGSETPARVQNGVARTNCIDCLDRTNAAQFVIGKCALGHQLHALGILDEPTVRWETDAVNLFTHMYHDHGDTIAVQYGGSQLVNTMETYRKINQWQSHSRDMLESFKRYYNNSFLDGQRQEAYNLFLGNYVYAPGQPMLWDLPTDYHLHHADPRRCLEQQHRRDYVHWFTPENLRRRLLPPLPAERPADPSGGGGGGSSGLTRGGRRVNSRHGLIASKPLSYFDDYWLEFYRPFFLSSFSKMFTFRIKSTMKYIPPGPAHHGQYDLSPFKVRSDTGGGGGGGGGGAVYIGGNGGDVDAATAAATAATEKKRSRHRKEVSFASTDDVASVRSTGTAAAAATATTTTTTTTAKSDRNSDTASLQGIMREGGAGTSSPGSGTMATSTAAATTATTTATIMSSQGPGRRLAGEGGGGGGRQGSSLDTTTVMMGGDSGGLSLSELDARRRQKKQSTLEKTRRAQWTLAKMVEGSLNPSVQETDDYERYISHLQNLRLVVPDKAEGGGVVEVADDRIVSNNDEYDEYVDGSWKTDGLGLGLGLGLRFGGSDGSDDETALYGELLRVSDSPLTVTEGDAQKKRYKAYRKWLQGKSFFKQQPVDGWLMS
ncbi:polyphosphoinositide phosphatase fig4 [Grosmannia clavigera kw1407]|uniref:Polyphosphoinositide phosphatase fig4 n=1 Tax=Grosmannia clavigera (strain kw1407 / UAMH 11150) TaxID=655863 RepID=F0XEY5_GROCL|nr:polyphosphoinositide phosphatase fig4 [Grosmannia clavigera kw1407]EFX04620.1 polyphosphoinositide phosphatase fig4 [Grosmannia clavigera kw1407]